MFFLQKALIVFIKNSLLYVSVSYEYIVGWCDKCPPASRLSQPFTALKIIKKVEYPVLEESILSLDMPAIDQLLGKWVWEGVLLQMKNYWS